MGAGAPNAPGGTGCLRSNCVDTLLDRAGHHVGCAEGVLGAARLKGVLGGGTAKSVSKGVRPTPRRTAHVVDHQEQKHT
jgi:hypothetical protein